MIPANNHPEIDRLIHLKKHLGGMTMSKLISCQFNIDTACVELVFDDGSQISIDCTAVENEVADNRFQRSELDYLIYNDPAAYADLILNGDPEKYLREVTIASHTEFRNLCWRLIIEIESSLVRI